MERYKQQFLEYEIPLEIGDSILYGKYHGYIYLIVDQKENKLYVGQKTIPPEQSKNYYGSGTIIMNIINKRGYIFLKKIILGEIFSNDINEFIDLLNEAEIECVYFFRSFGSDGKHRDEVYGYNLTIGGKGCVGFVGTQEQIDKRKTTLKNNPEIGIQRIKKYKETLKNNPNINKDRAEKKKETLENNPEIEENRVRIFLETWKNNPEIGERLQEKRSKTLRDKPQIMIDAGKKNSQTRRDNPEIGIEAGIKISTTKQNKSQEEKQEVNKKISETLLNMPTERREEITNKLLYSYTPEKRKIAGKKISEIRKKNKISAGRNHPLYKKIDSKLIIQLYFTNIKNSILIDLYNKDNHEKITFPILRRCLKVLNLPIKQISLTEQELKRNFIEQNKGKINWYIENYDKLEQIYFENSTNRNSVIEN